MLIMQPAHNDRKLRPRLSLSYTRFEAPDDREFVIVYCLHEFRRLFMVCRRPQLHTLFWIGKPRRSEEHTSELQSRSDLVCRLLLEKKKKKKHIKIYQND